MTKASEVRRPGLQNPEPRSHLVGLVKGSLSRPPPVQPLSPPGKDNEPQPALPALSYRAHRHLGGKQRTPSGILWVTRVRAWSNGVPGAAWLSTEGVTEGAIDSGHSRNQKTRKGSHFFLLMASNYEEVGDSMLSDYMGLWRGAVSCGGPWGGHCWPVCVWGHL